MYASFLRLFPRNCQRFHFGQTSSQYLRDSSGGLLPVVPKRKAPRRPDLEQ